jgi:hypothetical protein
MQQVVYALSSLEQANKLMVLGDVLLIEFGAVCLNGGTCHF